MIPGQREAVMAALFALVQTAAGFNTASRRVQWISETGDFPAVYVRHVKDAYERSGRGPRSKATIHAEIWLYASNSLDPAVTPETQLNALVDAVEAVLEPVSPPSPGYQTLGLSYVQHCWIEGDIEFAVGDTGTQGAVVIPVQILVP